MHVTFRGINEAFCGLVQKIDQGDRGEGGCETTRATSRNGPVLKVVGPATLTFTRPRERVLLNQVRDQNPFFVLYEGLHMLAGRNDVAPLAYYASRMSDYSDDGVTLNGAYGYRWRSAKERIFGFDTEREYDRRGLDQLDVLTDHLKKKPNSRRAVLQMWNVEDDLLKVDESKDVCCNLCALFSVRDTSGGVKFTHADFVPEEKRGRPVSLTVLDMTVFNRSNDLIWGLLGGDMAHFSLLQEYVAARLGVEVGVYNQITNDLHVYLEGNSGWKPGEWLKEYESSETSTERWYTDDSTKTVQLVQDSATFDCELPEFVESNKDGNQRMQQWIEPFLNDVARPMMNAFHYHKRRDYEIALSWINDVKADDWREAGRNWLLRRKKNWELKLTGGSSST